MGRPIRRLGPRIRRCRTRLAAATGVAWGAYVLADADRGEPEVILLATGSEVVLAWPHTRSSPPRASRRGW
ncbi:hypothetical protein [Streptomyces violaceusniger]|uniref:hypothetical protein n=1 Tax=Streptomyces violaceusniger TaxID=68280 RepID=UPI0026B6A131